MKEKEEERAPPPLQGALTVRKYRAHHVAECTVEGDLDDPWYPRQLGRTEEEEEEEEEGGQDERERNKSPERSRRAEEKGKPSEGSPERRVGMREKRRDARTNEDKKKEEWEGEGRRWYAKETYVPTRTPQDASWHRRA